MAKEINTYRDLSIKWIKNLNRFQLDVRPLGGARLNFKTKAEAVQRAKELFDKWCEGAPIMAVERWSVDQAITHCSEIGQLRVDDEQDTYGDYYYTQGSIECLDAIDAMLGKDKMKDFYRTQVVKYMWRMMDKGSPKQDAQKAKFYLDKLIEGLD